jgi:hypothetical protein
MTAEIVRFPGHRLYRCPGDHEDGGLPCCYCNGGLAFCVVCKGVEAELPTECPGEPMHGDTCAAVMNGHLDFRCGAWVCVSEEARRPVT